MANAVSCPQCGLSYPPEIATTVPRPPCPRCGARGIAIGIQPAIETDIAMPLEVAISPRYEAWDWKRRWEHAQNELGRLMARDTEELSGEAVKAAHRELQTFFIHTYHLKDALIAEAPSRGLLPKTIEDAITNDPDLALLADLANLDKHFKLNRPPRSGAVPEIISTQGVRAGSGKGGWRLEVKIMHNGKLLDGLKVASAALEAWRRHLEQWRLI
jgi:hypothetical protein